MLHRVFPEEEVGEVADIVGGDEVRFCRRRGKRGEESEWEKEDMKRKIEESQEKEEVQGKKMKEHYLRLWEWEGVGEPLDMCYDWLTHSVCEREAHTTAGDQD